ncbi:AbrB family transcriptional regulator [Halopseudomonas sp. SMJS2]|uniref:AbrB family transcriptional regulator n=1 Tax=Halopseudomonas sp. SMJS2 TaxID=3041098 RepID=UPI0024532F03|nr:AbrB family transcriptional regulator [Halopseudomonas sp. SMJS2]WGK61742.1 AbrB family transcriptional regulator [Halopseudomonas sp. SMJS2]
MSDRYPLKHLAAPFGGLLGGWLASLIHLPLPWMTGSLLAVILVRCSGWLITELPGGRRVGQWLVASAIGLHFTAPVLEQVLGHLWLILLGSLGTCLLSVLGIAILRRNGVDRATAFFSSMPGGASEMVVFALRHGADPARVAAAHSLRLLLVVLTIPAIFIWTLPANAPPTPVQPDWGWLLILMPLGLLAALIWRRLGQPNPWMLGPLLCCAAASAIFDLNIALPAAGSAIGQWLIGSALGCHFDRKFFRSAPAFLLRVLLFAVTAMLAAAAGAWLLGRFTEVEVAGLTLGLMPGGITELSLTAEALHLSVALVTALQVARLLLVMFFAEPVFRLWQRRAPVLDAPQ